MTAPRSLALIVVLFGLVGSVTAKQLVEERAADPGSTAVAAFRNTALRAQQQSSASASSAAAPGAVSKSKSDRYIASMKRILGRARQTPTGDAPVTRSGQRVGELTSKGPSVAKSERSHIRSRLSPSSKLRRNRPAATEQTVVATPTQPAIKLAVKSEAVEFGSHSTEASQRFIAAVKNSAEKRRPTSPAGTRPHSSIDQADSTDLEASFSQAIASDQATVANRSVGVKSVPAAVAMHASQQQQQLAATTSSVPPKPRLAPAELRELNASLKQPESNTAIAVPNVPVTKLDWATDRTADLDFELSKEQTSRSSANETDRTGPILLAQNQSRVVDRAFTPDSSLASVDANPSPLGLIPAAAPYPEREKIYFRPAVVDVNQNGQPVLRPQVRLARQPERAESIGEGSSEGAAMNGAEEIPPVEAPMNIPEEWAAPIVDGPYEQYVGEPGVPPYNSCPPPRLGPCQELCCRVSARLNGPCGCPDYEPGIGTERVMNAISFVETTQPMNNFRMSFDAGYDWESPDRSEYFWAKIDGRGPGGQGADRTVDYQDVRLYMEQGGKKFSVGTEIPIHTIEPTVYDGSGGIGDIKITTKTLFLDGKTWQMSQLFRTYIPSGDASAGLGTGHASIEPGFAWRMKYSDVTYFHADLMYWVPLGGDPIHQGEVLSYGIAMSHVWRETDSWAMMPTIELKGYTFLDGQRTIVAAGGGTATDTIDVDSDGILNIHPGIRWVWDKGSDCGVKEFGIFGGFAATSDHLYEELLRAEVRYLW